MACVDAEGELTASARAILEALSDPGTPEDASEITGLRLFRIRYMLRELQRVGLVSHDGGRYSRTEAGQAKGAGIRMRFCVPSHRRPAILATQSGKTDRKVSVGVRYARL